MTRRSNVLAARGMVATSQPLAAQAGLRMLLAGGTAADAAVAAAAALNVVEPMSTGIGGDLFALVYEAATGEVHALNASGRAPLSLTPQVFADAGLTSVPLSGWLPVTVPGAASGWESLVSRFGKLSLADVLAPAIGYAADGFPVSEIIASGWERGAPRLALHPAAAATYLPNGRAPHFGERFRQPNLAETLRAVARGGAAAFYTGEVAAAIVAASEREGGYLRREDLAQHRADWVAPIAASYRGHTVYECPPNGQGLTALLALTMLDGVDLQSLGAGSPEALHYQIEALRLAFADAATQIADPDAMRVTPEQLLAAAGERRRLIVPGRAMELAPATILPGGHDTVYVTAVDGDGNAVSLINSLYFGFGAAVVAGETGVCLQNRGAGFVLEPGHPNALAPGKRPYHTIIPCMVTRDRRLFASFGVMGGFMQPQGHVQMLVNMLDFGMMPQQALDAPRFELLDPYARSAAVALEHGGAMEALLAGYGHEVIAEREGPFGFGGGQIIIVGNDGTLIGGSDPRKDGCAMGY